MNLLIARDEIEAEKSNYDTNLLLIAKAFDLFPDAVNELPANVYTHYRREIASSPRGNVVYVPKKPSDENKPWTPQSCTITTLDETVLSFSMPNGRQAAEFMDSRVDYVDSIATLFSVSRDWLIELPLGDFRMIGEIIYYFLEAPIED